MAVKKNADGSEENMDNREGTRGNPDGEGDADKTIKTGMPPRTERDSDMIQPGDLTPKEGPRIEKTEPHVDKAEKEDVHEEAYRRDNDGSRPAGEREHSHNLPADTPGINEGPGQEDKPDEPRVTDVQKEEMAQANPQVDRDTMAEQGVFQRKEVRQVSEDEFKKLPEARTFAQREPFLYPNQAVDYIDFGLFDEALKKWKMSEDEVLKVRFYNDKVVAVLRNGKKLTYSAK